MKNNVVSVSNELVKASYTLSLTEKRLLICFISLINNKVTQTNVKEWVENNIINKKGTSTSSSTENLPKEWDYSEVEEVSPRKIYWISVKEYADLFDISVDKASHELKKAVSTLYERTFTYYGEDNTKQLRSRWISMEVELKDGKLGLCWSPGVIPLISLLRKNFTSYKLKWLTQLTGFYSIRWYELFKAKLLYGKSKVEFELSIIEIRRMFELADKYPVISDFKKRVIVEPIASINELTDLECNITFIRAGRSISSVLFSVKSKRN